MNNNNNQQVYASLWERISGFLIDIIILILINTLIVSILLLIIQELFKIDVDGNISSFGTLTYIPMFALIVINIFYMSLFESSKLQATVGKKIVKIYVIDSNGKRLCFSKALLRAIIKMISIVIFIGFLPILFTKKKQSLHDIILNCEVIKHIT